MVLQIFRSIYTQYLKDRITISRLFFKNSHYRRDLKQVPRNVMDFISHPTKKLIWEVKTKKFFLKAHLMTSNEKNYFS